MTGIEIRKIVVALVGKENEDIWWHSPNKAFDNKTPFDTILEDRERVEKYLIWHMNH